LKPVGIILTRVVGKKGRTMEGTNQLGFNICIHGNVTKKPPV
jgi:hypothetical protein